MRMSLGTCAKYVSWKELSLDLMTVWFWIHTVSRRRMIHFILSKMQVRGGLSWMLRGVIERISVRVGTFGGISQMYSRCRSINRSSWTRLGLLYGAIMIYDGLLVYLCYCYSLIWPAHGKTDKKSSYRSAALQKLTLAYCCLGRFGALCNTTRRINHRTIDSLVFATGTVLCCRYI